MTIRLKQIFYILTLTLGFLSCERVAEKTVDNSSGLIISDNSIKLHKLEKLFVVGDFDGDGKKDTILQHNYSGLIRTEIIYSPDPYLNDWGDVIYILNKLEVDVYLAFNKSNQDTLHLGFAQGLYCLINIGDNNNDGKDEIALVIDYLDYSRVNSCLIYSLCNNKWTQLKEFGVHEASFDFTTEKAPVFKEIKEYLEKQKGIWVYIDYPHDEWDNIEDIGKMMKLKIDKCK